MGVGKLCSTAKSRLPALFVNKVLWEHRPVHLFTCYVQLPSLCSGRVKKLASPWLNTMTIYYFSKLHDWLGSAEQNFSLCTVTDEAALI